MASEQAVFCELRDRDDDDISDPPVGPKRALARSQMPFEARVGARRQTIGCRDGARWPVGKTRQRLQAER